MSFLNLVRDRSALPVDIHVNTARQRKRMQGVRGALGTGPGGKRVGGSLSNRKGGVAPVGRKSVQRGEEREGVKR